MSVQTYRAIRLLKLRELFDAGGTATIPALADRYGVSIRTIMRDLDDLECELRYPLLEDDGQWRRAFPGEKEITKLERDAARLELDRAKLEKRRRALETRILRLRMPPAVAFGTE